MKRILSGVGLAISLVVASLPLHAGSPRDLMRFAADMAERGNWREARYRWESLHARDPDDAKVLNNLAVVREIMGEIDEARETYRRATSLEPDSADITENLRRFEHFWRYYWDDEDADSDKRFEAATVDDARKKKKGKPLGKTARVAVRLPVPPRIDVDGDEKILVTSFRATENAMLDGGVEIVKFLRAEFRKGTEFDVLEINPPPAIPEQTIPDLLANAEFWQHLGRNYETDIIVSGVIAYGRADVSGFREVDIVSARTGQKVRQSRFVEQEEFTYVVDLFFIDGPTGDLLHRDRLKRAVVFAGTANDPISAFFALSESVVSDVKAVISSQIQSDSRLIFKK